MTATEKRQTRNKLNNILHCLGTHYHESIPLVAIQETLSTYGLHLEPGIYCGADGHSNEPVGSGLYLSLTWHRMEATKRWEIVAYVS